MKFDDQKHLETWKRSRKYPLIHDPIAGMILARDVHRRGLDLCCSTGLLGQRLSDAGWHVWGVDGDNDAIARAKAAGITMPILAVHLDRSGLRQVIEEIDEREIRSVYARRCLPELFGHDLQLGRWFLRQLVEVGILDLFLQGRAERTNSVNRLSSIDDEIELASSAFDLAHEEGWQLAHLQAKTSKAAP